MKLQHVGDYHSTADFEAKSGEIVDLGELEKKLKDRADYLDEDNPNQRIERKRLLRFSAAQEAARLFSEFPADWVPVDEEAKKVYDKVFKDLPERYKRLAKLAARKQIEQEQ